jgi:hypothetical protein
MVNISEPEEIKPRQKKPKGSRLPPKPSGKTAVKFDEKSKACERLSEIAKKDISEAFKRWTRIRPKVT